MNPGTGLPQERLKRGPERGGVELTEYGPIYTRPVTVAMGNLLKHRAVGGFA